MLQCKLIEDKEDNKLMGHILYTWFKKKVRNSILCTLELLLLLTSLLNKEKFFID